MEYFKSKLLVSFLILSFFSQAQTKMFPSAKELSKLDSVILSRFQFCDCYDSIDNYNFEYIFSYNFIPDRITKAHLTQFPISDSIEKIFVLNRNILPRYLPYTYLEKKKNEYQKTGSAFDYEIVYSSFIDSLTANNSFVRKTNDSTYIFEDRNWLLVDKAYISNSTGELVGYFSENDWCNCLCSSEDELPESLLKTYKLLKEERFRMVFCLYNVGGENCFFGGVYFAITKDNEFLILIYPGFSDKNNVIISANKFVEDYWDKYVKEW